MQAVRLLIQGPSDGTTWVLAISSTSAAIPLDQPSLPGLAAKIAAGAPLMVQAETQGTGAVYYRWAQASGTVSEGAFSTATATAHQVCGAKFPNYFPLVGETVPVSTTHLVAKVAAGQPTGFLRIWAP